MTDKTTYALLIYQTSAAEPAPDDSERALSAHRALQGEASATGDLHAVARLAEVDKAKAVRRRGSAHDVTDGPYIDTKEWLVGFYLVDCADEARGAATCNRPVSGRRPRD